MVMTIADWRQLLQHLKSIGLDIAEQDRQSGTIVLKVSPLPEQRTRPMG